MNKQVALILLLTAAFMIGCQGAEKGEVPEHGREHGHENGAAPEAEQAKGPHGGKLFEKDGFAIEVTIYEPDIPPQSRVYAYENGVPLDPGAVSLVTELHRIDRVDTIQYTAQDDYLIGDKTVEEPHSFDVKLNATFKGEEYEWSYSSYEGRTKLSPAAVKSAGIEVEKAAGAQIRTFITLNGRVVPNNYRTAKLTARFPGVLKAIHKRTGDRVEKGESVATVESNESLRTYEVLAPRAGEILEVNSAVGEVVSNSDTIMISGDLSSVWVELSVPRSAHTKLKIGQPVLLSTETLDEQGKPREIGGTITYLSSLADGDSQNLLARAEVANPEKSLIPGLFIEAKVVLQERQVPVAIKSEALQKFRDWDVVFRQVGHDFEIAILELGDVDGDWIEVKDGLAPGTEYVTTNSFVVKADVMKSGASHDH